MIDFAINFNSYFIVRYYFILKLKRNIMTGYLTKTKDNEDLKNPRALTDYYMDTFMCNEYYLNY